MRCSGCCAEGGESADGVRVRAPGPKPRDYELEIHRSCQEPWLPSQAEGPLRLGEWITCFSWQPVRYLIQWLTMTMCIYMTALCDDFRSLFQCVAEKDSIQYRPHAYTLRERVPIGERRQFFIRIRQQRAQESPSRGHANTVLHQHTITRKSLIESWSLAICFST